MDFVEQIIDKLSRQMMLNNGYNETDNPVEWDLNIEDSQHAIVREMVGFVVTNTIEEINAAMPEEEESDEASDTSSEQQIHVDQYGKHHMELDKGAVRQHANFFIFLSNPEPGIPILVSDVREWLARVEALGIPDSREVEGSLYLDYDFDSTVVEKIECGECGQFDIITTTHICDGRWLERYQQSKEQQET